jgi:hypothetical protein
MLSQQPNSTTTQHATNYATDEIYYLVPTALHHRLTVVVIGLCTI